MVQIIRKSNALLNKKHVYKNNYKLNNTFMVERQIYFAERIEIVLKKANIESDMFGLAITNVFLYHFL